MKKELDRILDIHNIQEFNFIKKHCTINIVHFCQNSNWLYFKNNTEKIVVKLNAKQFELLLDKALKKTPQDKAYETLLTKFNDHLERIKTLNYRLKILMEEEVKLTTLDLIPYNAPEITALYNKMHTLIKEKIELQSRFSVYLDTFIEDTYLWQI